MALNVNPETDGGAGGAGHPKCTAGRKVVAVIGINMGMSMNNNPKADVHMTCLLDLEQGNEEGNDCWDTLTLTEKAKWKIANYAKAAGYNQPFDASNKQQLLDALSNRPFVVTLKESHYRKDGEDKVSFKVEDIAEYDGDIDDAWGELAEAGVARHAEQVKRAAEKNKGGGGGGSRWGNKSSGASKAPQHDEDDIPF
jgi:hypothetical protein